MCNFLQQLWLVTNIDNNLHDHLFYFIFTLMGESFFFVEFNFLVKIYVFFIS